MTPRRIAPIVVWIATIAFAAFWIVRQLQVTTDLSAFLPGAATPTQALLVDQLRDGVASRLVIGSIEGGDVEALAAASEALVQALAADPRFVVVANGNPARALREREVLLEHRYLLSANARDRLTVEGLAASLDELQRLMASPLAPLVRTLATRDPTGETLRVAQSLAGGPRRVENGVWLSGDGRRALLTFATRAPGYDVEAQAAAGEAIRAAFAQIAAPALTLSLTSPGLLAADSQRIIEHDAKTASSITLALVVVLLLATYRSVWPVALSALPALTGLATGVVVVSLAFGPVHAITLGFGAMLIGEAIDYPTYLFANHARGESLDATRARIGSTLVLAVATTACGALAMTLSGFRGLMQLGVLLIAGVVAAGLTTRYVLPALTPDHALDRKRLRAPVDASRWFPMLARMRWLVAVLVVVAVGVVVVQRHAIWDDDLANLNPVPTEAKTMDRDLRAAAGAPDLRYLVVAEGKDREEALRAAERAAALLDRVVADGVIAGYDTPARYLPSDAQQRARQSALPDAAQLRRSLDRAVAATPFRPDAFEPFVADVERARSGRRLMRDDLEGSALALRVDALLIRQPSRWVSLLPLSGVSDAAQLAKRLAASGDPSIAVLDLKAEADALVAHYRERSLVATGAGLLCVFAVLAVGVRSLPTALRLLAPVLIAVLMTISTLLATGQRLTLFHLVALLLVVGVGLNYALFFGREHGSADERNLTLLSVTVAGLATMFASVTLALSTTPVLRAIGLTTALGSVFAFVVSGMLAPRVQR